MPQLQDQLQHPELVGFPASQGLSGLTANQSELFSITSSGLRDVLAADLSTINLLQPQTQLMPINSVAPQASGLSAQLSSPATKPDDPRRCENQPRNSTNPTPLQTSAARRPRVSKNVNGLI